MLVSQIQAHTYIHTPMGHGHQPANNTLSSFKQNVDIKAENLNGNEYQVSE